MVERHGCIGLALSRQMIARSAALQRRMVGVAILSAPGRICAELAARARRTPDRVLRPAPVNTVLARELQTTRETVSRTINNLRRRGIVRDDGDALVVVSLRMLEDLIV
jgi:CRP-like cAMP-binding protein